MKKYLMIFLIIPLLGGVRGGSSFAQGLCCDVPGWQYTVEIDIDKPWDGKANDGSKIVPQGVYVWLIRTKDIKRKRHQYVGHVTLIR